MFGILSLFCGFLFEALAAASISYFFVGRRTFTAKSAQELGVHVSAVEAPHAEQNATADPSESESPGHVEWTCDDDGREAYTSIPSPVVAPSALTRARTHPTYEDALQRVRIIDISAVESAEPLPLLRSQTDVAVGFQTKDRADEGAHVVA